MTSVRIKPTILRFIEWLEDVEDIWTIRWMKWTGKLDAGNMISFEQLVTELGLEKELLIKKKI